MDPFTLKLRNFQINKILGYPHAGNDVFYVRGFKNHGKEIKGFLKVERQKSADIEREVSVIKRLDLSIAPTIIDYSLDNPKYILTEEKEGMRLSYILQNYKNVEILDYMKEYGKLLANIHNISMEKIPVKKRNLMLPHRFYVDYKLEYIEKYLLEAKFEENECFIHGDCHYANILWNNYKVSALLDYELSGYGSREYDLAWALILRPGQKFLKTNEERKVFLSVYSKQHKYSEDAFKYYMVLFGMYFYHISRGDQNQEYRNILISMINNIINQRI